MKDSQAILSIDENHDKDTKINLNSKFKNHKKIMINNEELVGGCCVCSDDQGFSNNALVYCDGKGCTVACHTACYGIVAIPEGDWYCRRCEAKEIHAPCRLCPMIEGAMKRTSDDGWAHVICALYIPEVSFGNNATMEPIILSKIPSTRYEQSCSICRQKRRANSETIKGACCECTVKNCSQAFHVTCAQQAGLLYEDVRKNNCQYPIYCEQHRPKFSKFIRQIPAFHYKSSDKKHNSSQLSDCVKTQRSLLSSEEKDETSQNSVPINSLTDLSQFVELSKEEQTSLPSLNQKQLKVDNSRETSTVITEPQSSISICTNTSSNDNKNLSLKKPFTPKIKIEENDIDFDPKAKQSHKKRHHSNEGHPRPVGRPPSKKTLLSQQKLKPEESQIKSPNQTHIESSSLTNSSVTQQTSFPPETLEEFLEQEWESTSDFLLQPTMPHDVSSLLSCLYQFKSENATLQKQFDELKHRRDSLRVTNVNLRRKLSEILTITNSQKPKSSTVENHMKLPSTDMEMFPNNSTFPSSLPYDSINPYAIIKNERIPPPTNGLSLELLSQILATNGPQLFAPTWNISNFGYANFPGANSISVSDESIIRSYPS